eukprot:TRINITY_DN3519_c0_g1_i1.p1 TRINITY_DN3519_c0_g1~~TRINITY_DN3519_c0_g1_i1.p1  ORF type:complete len:1196 (+),score=395.78 TRINITY_DN3519_c0_g1_i1:67-3654(+)
METQTTSQEQDQESSYNQNEINQEQNQEESSTSPNQKKTQLTKLNESNEVDDTNDVAEDCSAVEPDSETVVFQVDGVDLYLLSYEVDLNSPRPISFSPFLGDNAPAFPCHAKDATLQVVLSPDGKILFLRAAGIECPLLQPLPSIRNNLAGRLLYLFPLNIRDKESASANLENQAENSEDESESESESESDPNSSKTSLNIFAFALPPTQKPGSLEVDALEDLFYRFTVFQVEDPPASDPYYSSEKEVHKREEKNAIAEALAHGYDPIWQMEEAEYHVVDFVALTAVIEHDNRVEQEKRRQLKEEKRLRKQQKDQRTLTLPGQEKNDGNTDENSEKTPQVSQDDDDKSTSDAQMSTIGQAAGEQTEHTDKPSPWIPVDVDDTTEADAESFSEDVTVDIVKELPNVEQAPVIPFRPSLEKGMFTMLMPRDSNSKLILRIGSIDFYLTRRQTIVRKHFDKEQLIYFFPMERVRLQSGNLTQKKNKGSEDDDNESASNQNGQTHTDASEEDKTEKDSNKQEEAKPEEDQKKISTDQPSTEQSTEKNLLESQKDIIVVAVTLPVYLTPESAQIIALEDLFDKFGYLVVIEEEDVVVDREFEKTKKTIFIERMGYRLRSFMVASAQKMGTGMMRGSNALNTVVKPNRKKARVSKSTIKKIYNARVMTGKLLTTSMKTMNTLSMAYKRMSYGTGKYVSGTKWYKNVIERPNTKKSSDAKSVVGASIEAGLGLFYALRDSSRILTESANAAIVNTVHHKWGEEAGYAVQEALGGLRDIGLSGWYFYNAISNSWYNFLLEGGFECLDTLANFREWMSGDLLFRGKLLYKSPVIGFSSYTERYIVITTNAMIVFIDKAQFLKMLQMFIPLKNLDEFTKSPLLQYLYKSSEAVISKENKRIEDRKMRKLQTKDGGMENALNEEGMLKLEPDHDRKNDAEEKENVDDDKNNPFEKKPNQVETKASKKQKKKEAAKKKEEEIRRKLEAEKQRIEAERKKEEEEKKKRAATAQERESFENGEDMTQEEKERREKEQSKAEMMKKIGLFQTGLPLEEMDFVRLEEEDAEYYARRHTQENTFFIQTRDYSFHYFASKSVKRSRKLVRMISKYVVIAKEVRRNQSRNNQAQDLDPNSAYLPTHSKHDFIARLPKPLARPASLPAPDDVDLLPKHLPKTILDEALPATHKIDSDSPKNSPKKDKDSPAKNSP